MQPVPRYEYSDGKSKKFWSIEIRGAEILLRWGRIGSKGQGKQKSFHTPAEAEDEYKKAIAAKESKGYVLVSGQEHREASENESATNDVQTAQKALLSFVHDLANGDEEIAGRVQSLISDPPEPTAQSMGFYPRGDQDEFERVFLKTVRTLDDYGYLRSWEDKYVHSMLHEWITSEFVPSAGLRPETVYYTEKLRTPTSMIRMGVGPRDVTDDEGRELAENFESTASDIDAGVTKAGQALLSIDLSGGDHLYVACVSTTLAGKWKDVLFWRRGNGEPLAVRSFMWKQFATFLKYANGVELKLADSRADQQLRGLTDEHTVIVVAPVKAASRGLVRHVKFGDGEVLREIDSGASQKLEVRFGDGTCRVLLARFLEEID